MESIIEIVLFIVSDVGFVLKHYKLKTEDTGEEEDKFGDSEDLSTQVHIDALNISNDFLRIDKDDMNIAKYYGLREFIVLVPAKRMAIVDETRIKILVSSLTIAANNANW